MSLTKRLLEEIEAAERSGVEATATVWPVQRWKSVDGEIVQIADNAAWCRECGALMVAECGEWMSGFRCATCHDREFNADCLRCAEDIFDPAVESGNPDDARTLCDSCWDDVLAGA